MTAQSNFAANDRQPATGAFLALIPPVEPKSLKALVVAATVAADHASKMLRGQSNEYAVVEAENEARAARQALLDHLLFEHGIGGTLASKIGEVI